MDALVNYGSDDESSDKYQENKGARSEEMKTSGRSLSDTVEDVNYDNVQMDMSEESDAGQRQKGGEAGRSGSSASSSQSSSSEDEDEPPHVKPRISAGVSSHDSKRGKESREKDPGGSYSASRRRRREESKKIPGQKEHSRHRRKDRVGKRSRSKDRSEKLRESKEKDRDKRRRGNSRDRGGPHDGESISKDISSHKSGREGSCIRSRSRDRVRHRHHSDKRRSRSRSPHHHHRHHHRHHDENDRGSKRSRGRSSSKNHSGDECRSAEAKKANAVSRAVAAAAANIAAAVAATEAAQSSVSSPKNEGSSHSSNELGEDGNQSLNAKSSQQVLLEGLGLQVEGTSSKPALGGLTASLVTPQLLVQRSLEVQASHVHNATGIQFPAYYNPAAMNPLKYAEQMQKRKKLWGGNKDTSKESTVTGNTSGSTNNWESTTFAQDQDGKLSAKFKRLMGIKTAGATSTPVPAQPEGTSQSSDDVIKKQEELFSTMERQYEAARLATHTLRGVGLGFGSSSTYQYPR